ncbi:TPA: hypothetical protein ACOWTY_002600 [Klebsiella pneumoniae]
MKPLIDPIGTDDGQFHGGNQLTGTKGTIVTPDWLNDIQGATRSVQQEIIAVLTAAGLVPAEETAGQLLSALQSLFTGTGSFGTTGYIRLPLIVGGVKRTLIINWGQGSTTSEGNVTVTLPAAFPVKAMCAFMTNNAGATPSGFGGISVNLTTVTLYSSSASGIASGAGVSYNYIALGY